jgi:predicted RNA-binding Zn ribbon-like protein
MATDDDSLLLAVLNSAPVRDGQPTDDLVDAGAAELVRRWGGRGSRAEIGTLRRTRDALQTLIRGTQPGADDAVTDVSNLLQRVVHVPTVSVTGVDWNVSSPDDEQLAVRIVLAWSAVNREMPGRLRACANDECTLFLLDRSRPGTARWCSMSTCGNRMKARAHANRSRVSPTSE